MSTRRKLSYDDLLADRDRQATIAHVMTIAAIESPDLTWTYRDGRDRYVWTAYRLAGPVGGYLVGIFHGAANGRPSLHYCERLDVAIQGIRDRRWAYVDAGGICVVVERAERQRYEFTEGKRVAG